MAVGRAEAPPAQTLRTHVKGGGVPAHEHDRALAAGSALVAEPSESVP